MKYIVIIVFVFSTLVVFGQAPLSVEEIKQTLSSKGVNDQQLVEFMQEEGLTEASLATLSPEELLEVDKKLDAFLAREKPTEIVTERPTLEKEVSVDKTPMQVPSVKESDYEKQIVSRFGEQLFVNNNLKLYEENGGGPVPGNYVLNVGDEVRISIFGDSKLEQIFPIGQDGAIVYYTQSRRLFLAGLTLNEAREKIEKVFKQYYVFRKGEINIGVSGARTISVNLYGEVKNAGGYLISAVNSPINALLAANGISKNGSYRNITLLKDDGKSYNIDLYKFMTNPDKLEQVSLSNNDIIQVPLAQLIVKLEGAVKKPLYFELKATENLDQLLDFAGGLTADADQSNIQIERFENAQKQVIDIPTNSSVYRSFKLRDGDLIKIKSLESKLSNVVTVSGAVNNQGVFQFSDKMKISDLLNKLILNASSKTDFALINRTMSDGQTKLINVNIDNVLEDINSEDNLELQANDELLIWEKKRFVDGQSNVFVTGAIRSAGEYPFANNSTTLKDALNYSGGLRRDASNLGMIYRKDPLNNNRIQYIQFNPIEALKSSTDDGAQLLMPFDSIVILRDAELSTNYQVEIAGEVKNPGAFQFGEGMTVKDLIILSEGFSLAAQTDRIEVNRTVIRNNESTEIKVATINLDRDLSADQSANDYELQPFDKVYVRAVPEFELPRIVRVSGEVKYPGNYVLENRNEKLIDLIDRAGGFTKEAFIDGSQLERKSGQVGQVIMNVAEAKKSPKSKYNYILKEGDMIMIPKQEDIVTLKSATLYKRIGTLEADADDRISIAYFPGKTAKYYINEFGGGFGENADKPSVFVEHANGVIARTKDFGLFKVYPKVRKGSLIVIPEKPVEIESEKDGEKVDWTQLLNDSVTQAMSILTLLLLVERI